MHSNSVRIRSFVKTVRTGGNAQQIVRERRLAVIIAIRRAWRQNRSVRRRLPPKMDGLVISNVYLENKSSSYFTFEPCIELVTLRHDQIRREAAEYRASPGKLSNRITIRRVYRDHCIESERIRKLRAEKIANSGCNNGHAGGYIKTAAIKPQRGKIAGVVVYCSKKHAIVKNTRPETNDSFLFLRKRIPGESYSRAPIVFVIEDRFTFISKTITKRKIPSNSPVVLHEKPVIIVVKLRRGIEIMLVTRNRIYAEEHEITEPVCTGRVESVGIFCIDRLVIKSKPECVISCDIVHGVLKLPPILCTIARVCRRAEHLCASLPGRARKCYEQRGRQGARILCGKRS